MSRLYFNVISYYVFDKNVLINYRMTLGPLEYRSYYKRIKDYI